MKKIAFVLVASMMATVAMAQTITPQEERELYQKAYSVINEYAQNASVEDESMQYHFKNLFSSTDMQICNDLMSLSYKPTLSVEDYVRILSEARTVKVSVRNLTKKQIIDAGENWQLPVTIEKSISFVNSCGTYFDSREFFGSDYKLQAVIVMEKGGGRCYIGSLTADGQQLTFPEDYKVLVKNDPRDEKLDINGRLVSFNLYDQVLLAPGAKIKYLGSDVAEESVDGENCDTKINVNYRDKHWRVRPNFAYSFTDFNKIEGVPTSVSISQSAEMSFGLDLGYVFPSTGRLQIGLFTGVQFSKNDLKMAVSHGEFASTNDNDDEDGDSYTRYYSIGSQGISQEMTATDIAIPLYLDLEYRIYSSVSVYSDLGMKFQTSTGKFSGQTDAYETWGKYGEKYNNLVIRNNTENKVNLNGFGTHPSGELTIDDIDVAKSMAMDAIFSLGVRFNLGASFAIDAGVQYQLGLTNSWKSSNKSADIAHYKIENGVGSDKFYNILRNSDGVKHNAIKLVASLIYKF